VTGIGQIRSADEVDLDLLADDELDNEHLRDPPS
jgi:hypothetical protein